MSITPRHVYIMASAYQCLVDEARRDPSVETCGILVGRSFQLPDEPILLVVAASGPGPDAEQLFDSVAPDMLSLQRELEAWCERYQLYGVDYVGQWHTHPLDHHMLSEGDLTQIDAILADPDYILPSGILTPLVTADAAQIKLTMIFVPRTTGQPIELPWSILDGSAEPRLAGFVAQEESCQSR